MNQDLGISVREKLRILKQLYFISLGVDSPHTQDEMLRVMQTILSVPRNGRGVVVEAGCFKGGSTAKFSLAADIAGKKLVIFDSFEGIPDNNEPHDKNIFGSNVKFARGAYRGSCEEVKRNVSKFGKINRCEFIPGWFDDTMPSFREPIAAMYLDVDLAASTRTCLKYLYPLLEPGGVLYSQDGHLPLVIDVFNDRSFWRNEVGYARPEVIGLGEKKLIKIVKPIGQASATTPHPKSILLHGSVPMGSAQARARG
jgi:O-methyltransferase